MAWIEEIGPEKAEGLLKEAYERLARALGRVIPYYRAYSVSPRHLQAHLDFYAALGAPSALSKRCKELIGTAVSADNGCRHCTDLHAGFLRKLGVGEAIITGLIRDPAGAALDVTDRVIVDYALKLTRTPQAMVEADVQRLRARGLSDEAIFEVAFVTAYFNYTNRVGEGLGVEPES